MIRLFGQLTVVVSLSVSTSQVFAQLKVLSTSTTQAKIQNEPNLLDFSLVDMKKRIDFVVDNQKATNYMTDTRAVYTVKDSSQIEDYGIVQFIRGCQYNSYWDGKQEEYATDVSRLHFGETIAFVHKDWEIDSDSNDPLYSSYPEFGRFALLRWNKDIKSLDPATATYNAKEKPSVNRVFVTDLPGSVFVEKLSTGLLRAKNASLEFKTCIFRVADLPLTTDKKGSNIDQSKAVACLNWEHKFIYNFQKKKFVTKGAISKVCEDAVIEPPHEEAPISEAPPSQLETQQPKAEEAKVEEKPAVPAVEEKKEEKPATPVVEEKKAEKPETPAIEKVEEKPAAASAS